MDKQHIEQTRHLEKDLAEMAKVQRDTNARFDRHLEIYAGNKQELQAVKTNQQWLMRFFWALMTPTLGGIIYIIIQLTG